mgnify:FL=1
MTEFFYDYLLPLALQFGMSTREFWNEEPKLLWTYRKMYMDKIKIEKELENQQAWLQGLYFFNALSVSLYNNFGRKEGQPAENYMESPIDFGKKPKTQKEIEREQQLEMEARIRERSKQIQAMLNKKQEVK